MRSLLFAMLFALSATVSAAQYTCPPPSSSATVACTFALSGGTTTITASVSAAANGSSQDNSGIALFVTIDGAQCNDNYGVKVPVVGTETSAFVEGQCTFDVTSDHPVNLFATAQSQNATPAYISLVATKDAFVRDAILTVTTVGSGSITSADGRIDCGFDCYESYTPNSIVTLYANAAQGWAFTGWTGNCSGSARSCTLTVSASGTVTANFAFASTPTVVEFYNAPLDHYFITADAVEAAALDNGSAGPGWSRTGLSFRQGGDMPVCRFYGSVSPGPNSHFYTAFAPECFFLQQLAGVTPASQPRWNFEGIAFSTTVPLNGACPGGTIPVYRAYNNGLARGKESNHRFTTNLSALNDVIARGWKNEGIVMCAPQF